ncbi:MAG: DUF3109 family protein [Bacteroidales bacterium]|jgi:hypothetical protein|nr:DUF3109 family protein [Bacteroidales bacterium]
MVEIGRTLISDDIFEEYFMCDLLKCKGNCCIEGDSGAFITSNEAAIIKQDYSSFEVYIPEEHIKEIKKQGYSVIDNDGDLVTPLVNNRQCVYSFNDEKGILKCSMEKAYFEGKTNFRKPVSCHLFPIRITEYEKFDAVNYQKLDICKPGIICGSSSKLPLFKFLKEPLIRKYGHEWFMELEMAAKYIMKNQ